MRQVSRDDEFAVVGPRLLQAACRAMAGGDPSVRLGLWARADDATLFGAWGPCKKGWAEIEPVIKWVGTRFEGGDLRYEGVVAWSDGDVGLTVGYERGETVIDGQLAKPMTIRVTHAWRRQAGEWKIIHRHGDFAPLDESPRTAGQSG